MITWKSSPAKSSIRDVGNQLIDSAALLSSLFLEVDKTLHFALSFRVIDHFCHFPLQTEEHHHLRLWASSMFWLFHIWGQGPLRTIPFAMCNKPQGGLLEVLISRSLLSGENLLVAGTVPPCF